MNSINYKDNKFFILYGCDVVNEVYSAPTNISNIERCLRSDTIMLLILNVKTNKVKLISILRDISIDIAKHKKCKLNSLIVYYGPKKATKIIGRLLGIKITKYIVLDMQNMIKIIDLIGGVEVNLTYPELVYINNRLQDSAVVTNYQGELVQLTTEGMNNLNGIQTLTHIRNRVMGYTWARTQRQREVIISIIKKLKNSMSRKEIILLCKSLLRYVETNLNIIDVFKYGRVITKINIDNIKSLAIPSIDTESIKTNGTWRFELDFNDVKKYLKMIINDEDVEGFIL